MSQAGEVRAGRPQSRVTGMVVVFLPLLLLAGIVALVLVRGPGAILTTPVPVERLDFERVAFRPKEIVVTVRNSGPNPASIAHVIVNGALWNFTATPDQEVPRLRRATLVIPFDWVEGEPYTIELSPAPCSNSSMKSLRPSLPPARRERRFGRLRSWASMSA